MSKLAKYIIWTAVTALALFLVWYFSNIVAYILVSAVLAIIGKPMVDQLEKLRFGKRRMPRWLSALITLLAIWFVAILFFTFFIPLIFSKLGELSTLDIPMIVESFRGPLESLQECMQRFFSVDDSKFSIAEEVSRQLSELFDLGTINNILGSIVSFIGNTAIALFSITFITYFFLKEEDLFLNMLITMFPKRYEQNIEHAMNSITKLLIRYFTGILAESMIMMIVLFTAFLLWGFSADTAIFMGMVVGVLNVIPYIGPIIGACFCIIVGVLSPLAGVSMGATALIILGTVLFAQAIDNFILQPYLYSNRVNAHPLEIFLVILIAGSVAGVLGMLLAIPAYNVIRVFAKEFFNNLRVVQKLTGGI